MQNPSSKKPQNPVIVAESLSKHEASNEKQKTSIHKKDISNEEMKDLLSLEKIFQDDPYKKIINERHPDWTISSPRKLKTLPYETEYDVILPSFRSSDFTVVKAPLDCNPTMVYDEIFENSNEIIAVIIVKKSEYSEKERVFCFLHPKIKVEFFTSLRESLICQMNMKKKEEMRNDKLNKYSQQQAFSIWDLFSSPK